MHLRMTALTPMGSNLFGISFTLHTRDGFDQLEVAGTVDAANAPELRAMLLKAIDNCTHHLLVDITGVDFADASGLGVLVGALGHARTENKRINLACTDERLLKVFALMSLDRSFGLFGSADAAIQANAEPLVTAAVTGTNIVGVAS